MKVVGVIGAGPAGLMAAYRLSQNGCKVFLFEKRVGPARKLYIAGRSGLNISSALSGQEILETFGEPRDHWRIALSRFSVAHWLDFLKNLGLEFFVGTSKRYFIKEMHAGNLIRLWREILSRNGVEWKFNAELSNFKILRESKKIHLEFAAGDYCVVDAVCLALGGASYEPDENPLRWPKMFMEKNILLHPFEASNVGFSVDWNDAFLREAEGKPLKNIRFSSSRGTKLGDLIVTRYGVEGTPVYTFGEVGTVFIDLKPDIQIDELKEKCLVGKENLSPMRRIKRFLKLGDVALALLFHHSDPSLQGDLESVLWLVKNFPLNLTAKRPLDEAISSSGGVMFSELNEDLMLRKYPGVFLAGEMIDWDVPTGGFLIQGCVSQGALAADGAIQYLHACDFD